MFVIDSSMALSWVFREDFNDRSARVLEHFLAGEAIVPALFHWEVANVLNLCARKGRITAEKRFEALDDLQHVSLAVDRGPTWEDMQLVADLAQKHKLTVYDAAYLELALRYRVPLASIDEDLNTAATTCGVELLGFDSV